MLETQLSDRNTATELIDLPTTMTTLGAATRFVLHVFDAALVRVREAGGFDLSGPVGTCRARGERIAARIGPEEWLLIASPGSARALVAACQEDLSSRVISLVEATRRYVAFQISGPRAAAVLNTGIPLDLSDLAFPAGSATSTLLGETSVVLIRTSAAPVYRVECPRACAPHVEAFFREALRTRG